MALERTWFPPILNCRYLGAIRRAYAWSKALPPPGSGHQFESSTVYAVLPGNSSVLGLKDAGSVQLGIVVAAAVLDRASFPWELPGGHQDRPDEEHRAGATSMT